MSFILDALRKSEHERQRGSTPGIANVPFSAPRKVLPIWAVTLIVVLGFAVLALGGAWLRTEWSRGASEARVSGPSGRPLASGPRVATPPERAAPRAAPEAGPPPAERGAQTLVRETARATPQSSLRAAPANPSATALAAADEPRSQRLEHSAEPAGRGGPVLPSAAALEAEGIAVPKLELQLLAYYDTPADRYVFINGTKYREGATLAEGPRVMSIATNGAVLSYLGREFMLTQ